MDTSICECCGVMANEIHDGSDRWIEVIGVGECCATCANEIEGTYA